MLARRRSQLARECVSTRIFLLLSFLLLAPSPAQAHEKVPGIGEFGNGLIHPFFTPAHGLIVLGIGLLVGQSQRFSLKAAQLTFIPATGLGLFAALLSSSAWNYKLAITVVTSQIVLAICLGTLVAIGKSMPPLLCGILSTLSAFLVAFDSGPEGTGFAVLASMLLGTWIGICVVFGLVARVTGLARQHWSRIAVRILGSWIIAIAVLVLAFLFKPKH